MGFHVSLRKYYLFPTRFVELSEMSEISGLNFTVETSIQDKLPFLNVMVEKMGDGSFKTTVYRKPTDIGTCMNANGDCPDQYKSSVIKGFLFRAKKLTSEKTDFLLEVKRAKQILINNGFSNKMVDDEIKIFLKSDANKESNEEVHNVYYKNFMNSNYRQDEETIKEIIKENVKTKKKNSKVNLIVYYKTRKTAQLFMKNNINPNPRELATTNVIYQFECERDECQHLNGREITYSGATTCTVSRRISLHLQNGAILKHFESKHSSKITRKEFEDWTKIRYIERDVTRLFILEALIIKHEDPVINRQDTGKRRTLKLHGES